MNADRVILGLVHSDGIASSGGCDIGFHQFSQSVPSTPTSGRDPRYMIVLCRPLTVLQVHETSDKQAEEHYGEERARWKLLDAVL